MPYLGFFYADGQDILSACMVISTHETLEVILSMPHEACIISEQHLPEKDTACFDLRAQADHTVDFVILLGDHDIDNWYYLIVSRY